VMRLPEYLWMRLRLFFHCLFGMHRSYGFWTLSYTYRGCFECGKLFAWKKWSPACDVTSSAPSP